VEQQYVSKIVPFLNVVRVYHEHEVKGMGHIPQEGAALLVMNHSLATYDIGLLFAAVYESTGRIVRPLADNLFFKIPYLSQFVQALGGVRGTQKNAKDLLRAGEIVAVAPGGMKEALRPSSDKYKLMWETRKGFVALAIEMQVPVILAMCPKADDIYNVYCNPITPWIYERYRIPLFCIRGIGPTLIPKKVQLTHFVSAPLAPPKIKKSSNISVLIDSFHKKILTTSNGLMTEALKHL
jgi:1-acyl-sn-glycerol-3-phosphate acyltransferase